MDKIPYQNISSPSPTSPDSGAKISRPRKGKNTAAPPAPPLASYRIWGREAAVTVKLQPRIGSELYIEVSDHRGRFWIRHDASVVDLIFKLQEGGYRVAPPPGPRSKGPRRS